jgi:hypothetical protein
VADQQLEQIVQRMVDAGESEQDIADVIREYGSAPESGGISPWLVGAGAVGAGALALAAHNPALLKTAGEGLMDLRRTSMLSGLAPLKSLLGNIGGAAYGSIERGSLDPLRELLSGQTVREAADVFKNGHMASSAGPTTSPMSKWNIPGRIMGALDTASQNALQRAGYTSEEAAREMLQAPIPHEVGAAFDNPVMDYLVPFRKTPLNQLLEGAKTFNPQTMGQKAALGTSLATGAASGYEADDPKTVALTTAASGRYGLPHAIAAGAARAFRTGDRSKAADIVDAASDFGSMGSGVVGPVVDPTSIVPKPAAFSAYQYLKSLLGMQ